MRTTNVLTLPLRATPLCTALLIICVAVQLLALAGGGAMAHRLAFSFGVIPGVLLGNMNLQPQLTLVPAWATLLTSLFVHGGLGHLVSNMIFLWAVGRPLELVMGRWRLAGLYVVSGIAAGLLEAALHPQSSVPVIGASGSIAGLFAGYLLLFGRSRPGDEQGTGRRALGYLALWLFIQGGLALVFNRPGNSGGMAIWAHVGGFVAGLLLMLPVARRLLGETDADPQP